MVNNWTPPRNRMTAIREVQPEVGLPSKRVRTTTNSVITKARKHDERPATKANIKGKSEKFTIPSIE